MTYFGDHLDDNRYDNPLDDGTDCLVGDTSAGGRLSGSGAGLRGEPAKPVVDAGPADPASCLLVTVMA
jgi:hypothetical protein